MLSAAERFVAVEHRDGGLVVYQVGPGVETRADAERHGRVVAIRRMNRTRAWRRFVAGVDGRALRFVERIGGGSASTSPTLVELTLSATDWRKRLAHSHRRRILDLCTPRLPEDGERALVVLGPFERSSTAAMLVWGFAASAGIAVIETIVPDGESR
jgi:hypothetical protein